MFQGVILLGLLFHFVGAEEHCDHSRLRLGLDISTLGRRFMPDISGYAAFDWPFHRCTVREKILKSVLV